MRTIFQTFRSLALGLVVSIVATMAVAAGDSISGTVTSADGVEAGVWVIAETGGLATTFRKIVVTDDKGRFLLPELPEAEYSGLHLSSRRQSPWHSSSA